MPRLARAVAHPSKRLLIGVAIAILSIVGWLVASLLSVKFTDRSETFYPSLIEAKKDGAIDRGWIPGDLLPASSATIHELHNLSPAREWCAFAFATQDSEELRKKLKGVDVLPPSVRVIEDPAVSWWPTVLKGNLDTARIRNEGFDLYAVERPANSVQSFILLFAIDWSKGRAFFYVMYK
jgi:hypothetical protein